jgi:hypothetical protein
MLCKGTPVLMAGSDVTYDLGLSTTVNRLEILTRASETKIVVLPLRQNEVWFNAQPFLQPLHIAQKLLLQGNG